MLRYIGTYLIIFAILAGALVLIFGIEVFFRYKLSCISCIFTSLITATIFIKKEFEFKSVFKETLIFLIISAILLILTHFNYELSFTDKNMTLKKLYIQIYYLIDFISYFIFSYIPFIITKKLVNDGILKKIILGFLIFIFIAASLSYTAKKMSLVRGFENNSRAIILYKDGVGVKKIDVIFRYDSNLNVRNCTEVTLEIRKPLYKLGFNEKPKEASQLKGTATIKYSYGDDNFQENIEIKNAKADKIKNANYHYDLSKLVYVLRLMKFYKTPENYNKRIDSFLELSDLDETIFGNDIYVYTRDCKN